MTTYRTPDEIAEGEADDARINRVLDDAVNDLTEVLRTMDAGDPRPVFELRVNMLYHSMRNALDGEDRLYAIALLLLDEACGEVRRDKDSRPADPRQRAGRRRGSRSG